MKFPPENRHSDDEIMQELRNCDYSVSKTAYNLGYKKSNLYMRFRKNQEMYLKFLDEKNEFHKERIKNNDPDNDMGYTG